MTFESILFERAAERNHAETAEPPACFGDLNLDQIVDAVTAGKQEYNLKPFFYAALHQVEAVHYRHEIFRALENSALLEAIQKFAKKMRALREHLEQAAKLYYKYQKEKWFLDAAQIYCDAVKQLAAGLVQFDLRARGLLAFREFLTNYVNTDSFRALHEETKQLGANLSTIRYTIHIKGNRVNVRKYEEEIDSSAEVEETFAKFKLGAVKDYRAKFPNWQEMNHVEAQVLTGVAQMYPEIFLRLDNFYAQRQNFLDETIRAFDREIQFYLAYLEHRARFQRAGLAFCYPRVSTQEKRVCADQAFDLALADKLVSKDAPIVCNDFFLQDAERILIVTGPNQGGKTTFARMFGQLHYLASLGCPVPGSDAQLFLFDQLLTHFEREENIENLRGKLEDDLFRIHAILERGTPNSIFILNEIFNSTTLQDEIFLSQEILQKITALDALCVCVTFLDELAALSEKTVSMVATVMPDNPTERTFKIERKRADGLAYALSLAEKYHLTFDSLQRRMKA